jgi:hypothetical protein
MVAVRASAGGFDIRSRAARSARRLFLEFLTAAD